MTDTELAKRRRRLTATIHRFAKMVTREPSSVIARDLHRQALLNLVRFDALNPPPGTGRPTDA